MKKLILSTAIATLLASTSLAQNETQPPRRVVLPAPPSGVPVAVPTPPRGGNAATDDAPRFDLKFPGGKVKEFVAAVSKALGKPVNVIIPKEGEETLIPAVDVSRVTVAGLFSALSNASQHEVAFPTTVTSSSQGVTNRSIQFMTVGFNFRTEEKNSPDGVWTFSVKNLPESLTEKPVAPPRTVQYYPVAEYLSHFSVEDITAAIESGWKLQGDAANPPPTIRFHEETKLLIIAGTPAQMEMIPQVLQGLSQMLRYPRSESLPIARKAGQIILPKLQFQEATVGEAVDFIRLKAAELDPEKKGFNIVVNEASGASARKVTLALSHIPALEVLKLVAQLSGMELEVRDHAFVLSMPGPSAPGGPGKAFPPALRNPQPQPGTIVPSAR